MNANAHLRGLGWAGEGNSLPSTTGTGLARPLLVSKKSDLRGIGKKKHDHADQWWLKAFDEGLKGLNTSGGKNNGGGEIRLEKSNVVSKLDLVKNGGSKWVGSSALYTRFVKGEGLEGTLTPESVASSNENTDEQVSTNIKKEKGRVQGETKAERRTRKEARRTRKMARTEKNKG